MVIGSLAETLPDELEEIFEEETAYWQRQLYWDYLPALKLIRRFIGLHSLPGLTVKTEDGRMAGYSYYVVDRGVGFIGNLFIRDCFASAQLYRSLVETTLHTLRREHRIKRIECQIFPFNCDLTRTFQEQGFRVIPRWFLVRTLETLTEPFDPIASDSIRVKRWDASCLISAAEVVFDSYRHSPDVELCRDYQSQEGCIRFFRNLIENPACGIFNPHTSLVAVNAESRICGVLLSSNIGPETGMIPQISICRSCQGRGLGTRLLQSYMRAAKNAGLKRITLSVSEENQKAFRLYRKLGFEPEKQFSAYVWTHP